MSWVHGAEGISEGICTVCEGVMAQRIRKGDRVWVTKGRDRGKQGLVQRVLPGEGRLMVEGVNMMKRHLKPRPDLRQAGIVDMEVPLAIANVALFCPQCNHPVRVGFALLQDGRKVRVCKKCQANID